MADAEPDFSGVEELPPEAPSTAAAPTDPVDEGVVDLPSVQDVREQENASLSALFKASLQTPPDRKAAILELIRQTGAPSYAIEGRFDDFQKTWQASQFDPEKWRHENPGLANLALTSSGVAMHDERVSGLVKALRWLGSAASYGDALKQRGQAARAEATASLAGANTDVFSEATKEATATAAGTGEKFQHVGDIKQVPTITAPEASASGLSRPFEIGAAEYHRVAQGIERSKLGFEILTREMRGLDTWDLEKQQTDLERAEIARDYGQGPFEQVLLDAMTALPSQAETLTSAGTGGLALGAAGTAAGAVVGSFSENPAATLELAHAWGMAGLSLGGRSSMALASARLEAGSAYLEYRKMKTDDGTPVSPDVARGVALLYGFGASAIETSLFGLKLKALGPVGEALAGGNAKAFLSSTLKAFAPAAEEAAKSEGSALLVRRTLPQILAKVGKAWAGEALGEGVEESSQQALQDVLGYGMKSATAGKLQQADIGEALAGQAEAGRLGLIGGAALGGGGSMFHLTTALLEHGKSLQAGQQVAALAGLKDSPTVKAAPEAVAQMVADATASTGEPVTHLYVDPVAFTKYFQEQDGDPREAATRVLGPDGPAKLTEARVLNQKLAIPVATYLEKLGGTEAARALVEHTTTQPHFDTTAHMKEDEAHVQERAKELATQYEEEHKKNEAQGLPTPQPAWVDAMEQQLVETKQMKPAVAKAQVRPMRAFITAASEKFGLPPEELFKNDDIAVLPPEGPEREKALVERGLAAGQFKLEQPAFHGTPHDFEKFSLQAIGSGEGAQAYGWGLYFASNKAVAEYYRTALSKPKLTLGGEPVVLSLMGPYVGGIAKILGRELARGSKEAALEHAHLVAFEDSKKAEKRLKDIGPYASEGNRREAEDEAEGAQRALEWVRDLRDNPDRIGVTKPGQTFQVEVPEHEELLDFDKTLADQPPAVRRALEGARDTLAERARAQGMSEKDINYLRNFFEPNVKGEMVLDAIGDFLAGQVGGEDSTHAEAKSRFLLSIGIPGLKYLDRLSRGDGEGSHNYVIWDDKRVEVTGKLYQDEPKGPLEKAVAEHEERIRHHPTEHAVALDADGKILFEHSSADSSQVRFTQEQLRRLRKAKNATLTHNHPAGRILSVDDMLTAIAGNLAEIRAVQPDGTVWRVVRPEKGWGYTRKQYAWARIEFENANDEAVEMATSRMNQEVLAAGGDPAENENAKGYDSERWRQIINEQTATSLNEFSESRGFGWRLEREGRSPGEGVADGRQPSEVRSQLQGPTETASQEVTKLPQTQTPAFRSWFGNSKVVDEHGAPKVVYHGSRANFDAFDKGKLGSATEAPSATQAFFFSGRPNTAESYTDMALPHEKEAHNALFDEAKSLQAAGWKNWVRTRDPKKKAAKSAMLDRSRALFREAAQMRQEGGNMMPVFLKLENPLVVDMKGKQYREETYNEILQRAKAEGHDGAVIKNTFDAVLGDALPDDIYAVFEPEQVKSAIGNRGTFDANDPSILHQGEKDTARGYTLFAREGVQRIIRIALNKNANLSTFLHESGHVFLELFGDLAEREDAPEKVKEDYATLLKHLGVTGRADIEKAHHEKFAKSLEVYFREGKAPSLALAGVFDRFKGWLKSVYQSIRPLGVELNDDIRGVMDRMFASDEEIAAAKKAMGLTPLFNSPEQANMTPAEWQAYLKYAEAATSSASRALEQKLLEERHETTEAWWQEELSNEKGLAEHDYEDLPARRAQRQLLGLGLSADSEVIQASEPLKLNRATAEALVGKERAKRLNLAADGIAPDELAEQFGYPTGKALLDAVLGLPEKDAWTDQRAADVMQDKHPQVFADRNAMRDVAAKGLHSEESAKWLLKEWEALRRKAKFDPETQRFFTAEGASTSLPPLESIRRAARLITDNRTVDDITPGRALRAERSAANKAAEAVAKGNFGQAAVYKQQQLLNMYLYRELTEATQDKEAFEKLASEMSKDTARAKLGKAAPIYRDGVDSLLETFGLKEPDAGRETELPSLGEVVARMEADEATILFDENVVGQLLGKKTQWDAFTVAQMREVSGALKNIRAAARAVSTALVEGKRQDKAETIAKLAAEAAANMAYRGPVTSSKLAETTLQQLGGVWNTFDGTNRRPEMMLRALLGGGDLDSTWYRAMVQPVQDAKVTEVDLIHHTLEPMMKVWEHAPSRGGELVDGKALFPNHREDLAAPTKRFELLMMLLHSGSESSLSRLLEGRNISMEQWQKMVDMFTKEELDWAQGVWDAIESLRKPAFDLEERDSGLRPEKVEARSLQTKHGEYRGGYFPAVYDRRVENVGKRQEGDALSSLMDPGFTRPGTSRGHLKARVQGFTGALSLDPSIIPSHIAQVIHDVAFREAVKSVGGLIMAPEIQKVLRDRLGAGYADTLLPWIKDVGQMRGAQAANHGGALLRAARKVKANTTIAALGYSVKNAIEDSTNLLVAPMMTDLKMKHMAAATAQFMASPRESFKMATQKSGELRSRHGELQRELQAQARAMNKSALGRSFVGNALTFVKHHAFFLMEASDKATSTPVWMGAYRQGLIEGEAAGKTGAKLETDAVTFADVTVRQSFPSHSAVDMPAILRDKGVVGTSLMFYGYLNTLYNLTAEKGHKVRTAESVLGMARESAGLIGGLLAATVVSEFLRGRGREGDEDWEQWFFRKLMFGSLALLPYGGDLANLGESWWQGKRSNPRNQSLAGVVVNLADAAKKAAVEYQNDGPALDKRIQQLIMASGPVLGYPTVAPATTGRYLYDVATGNRQARDPFDFTSGVIYGEKDNQPDNPLSLISDALSGPR